MIRISMAEDDARLLQEFIDTVLAGFIIDLNDAQHAALRAMSKGLDEAITEQTI